MSDQVVNQLIMPVVVAFILAGASVIGTHLIKCGRKRDERSGETSAKEG